MNYAYIFVDNLNGHSYENGINELKASISSFKNIQEYNRIHVFNNELEGKNIDYFRKENLVHNNISLCRNYGGSDKINPINILVEKIVQLMNFDEDQEIVLMDIDTSSQKKIPKDFFDSNHIVFDAVEYPIMQWRNLDKVLPQIPWKQFDISFDNSFMMYNTGVIYIPKKFRKELCEKALKIVDYLNENFDAEERCGNKLDEQIALSIVCHDTYGRFGHIKYSSDYILHHWEDRQKGVEWWKSHLNYETNLTEKYNIVMKYNQFGHIVDENFCDESEKIAYNLFEKHVLDLKSKNKKTFNMIELGSNYSFYSMLFKKILGATNTFNLLLEPFEKYMNLGKEHFQINNFEGIFLKEKINNPDHSWNNIEFDCPFTTIDELLERYNIDELDVLHSDIDTSEIYALSGAKKSLSNKKIDLVIIMTHVYNEEEADNSFKGIPSSIHAKCKEIMSDYDYDLLYDHPMCTIGSDGMLLYKKRSSFNQIQPDFPDDFYDEVFHNYPKILDFFIPTSYLDVGTCKGHAIPFIIKKLPSLTTIEMIEACEEHEEDLKLLSEKTKIPYHIEVLSNDIKEVTFYSMKDADEFYTQPGNSYYKENTPHYLNCKESIRVTNTLDNIYKNKHFDLIKLDTQGSELDILKGGKNMIKCTKGLILEETAENYHNFNNGAPKDIDCKKYLKENDFIFIEYLHDYQHTIQDSNFNWVEHRQHDAFYVKKDLLKLPISIGILSWKSDQTLRNTLESYRKNGLFDIIDDVILFFQEVSDDDRNLAKEYNIPFISIDNNVGIANAFIKLAEVSKEENILLLEHDWELTEDIKTTFLELRQGIEVLNKGSDCVRYRSINNPGYPLYSQNVYQGNELNHYDHIIDLVSPHLFECRHWIKNIHEVFSDKIQKEENYFVTTSRWSNFTNNPCLYKKDFFLKSVYPFKDRGQQLENDISYWWARQNFKVAWGNGLFTHRDIEKHEVNSLH